MALPVVTIDENGVLKPDYEEVRAYLVDGFQTIFGDDIYVDPDSQDGQLIAIFANALNEANAMALQVYTSFSPSTARGAGLSANVKINGLQRHTASYSSVDLLLVGQAGSTITSGIAMDDAGNQWLLPDTAVIPAEGEVTVTATAKELGAIAAAPDTITKIGTPTQGWQTVTNPAAATAGAPVETDAELRQRQTVSTAIPSQTIFEGIIGAIADIDGVARYRGYENDTNVTDADGLPSHSIAVVVDGGDATAIAQAIADKKTPGTQTYGTTSVDITDDYGVTRAIRFFRPTAVTIKVAITLTAQTGYTSTIEQSIKDTVADWITSLEIGTDVEWAEVFVPANLNGASDRKTYKISALTIAKNSGAFSASDIDILFDEAAETTASDVTITVVS